MIFDWDEYSLDLCSDINQLNEYLPLYAFINTHSTMDVSVQDMRMALWFFEYALGQAEDIAIRMRQYTDEYLDNITPRSRKPCLPTSKSGSTPFVRRGIWAAPHIKKARLAACFMIFRREYPQG
ncbi:lysine decarboxylase, constitutive [Escherichia coli]|uniref:Lysine decarboxylase, constitutive n=1 Tax=Escherichia coli TaxID=562 RepID=A0A2X3M4M6_ECOLX|nr:lysine decarboxylase, constitutive [Escherichia coli]